jgi:hypothetical protein
MGKDARWNETSSSFPEFTKDQKPLVIDVANGRWNAYAQNSPPTPQDEVLFNVLEAIGGVSMSAPPGRYHFIVTGFGSEKLEIHMIPVIY